MDSSAVLRMGGQRGRRESAASGEVEAASETDLMERPIGSLPVDG